MRVTPSLDTLETFEICNPAEDSFIQSDPTVIFTGTNYLAAWIDEKYGPSNYYHPFVARIAPDGTVLDTGVRVSTSSMPEYRPNLADDGERSFVVWSGSSAGCFGRFVNRDGMPEGNVVPIAPGTTSGPNLAFGDSCYLVAWFSGTYPALELYASLVSRTGELLVSPIPIATGPDCHRWADVAYDGSNFLVVWQTGLNNQASTIYGQFIADDGTPILTPFPINGNEPQQRWWPAIAVSDSNILVAWEQGVSRDVWGNVDISLTGVAESPAGPTQRTAAGPTMVSARLPGSRVLFDALGRRVAKTARPGVYFSPGARGKLLLAR